MKVDIEVDKLKRIGKRVVFPIEIPESNANGGVGVIQNGYNPATGGPLP